MKKRVLVLVTMVSLVSVMLGGCGKKATVTSVFDDMQKVTKEMKSMEGTVGVDFNAEFSTAVDEGMATVPISLKGEIGIQAITKSETDSTTKVDGSFAVSAMGMSQDIKVASYSQVVGTTATSYNYDSDSDSWSKEEVTVEDMSSLTDILKNYDFTSLKEKFVLAKDTVKHNDKDCYQLTGSFTGEDVKDLVTKMSDSFSAENEDVSSGIETVKGMDLSTIKADITILVDKKTSHPVSMTYDLSKSDISALSALLGEGASVTLKACSFTMDITGFDNVDKIEIPQEALDADAE